MNARMLSYWESRSFHRTPDFVVIGCGIVGSFTALFHKRRFPHHHVVIVERGPFPIGASVKNAGFACFGSPSELLEDIATEGKEIALGRVEERWRGLLELRAELGDGPIGLELCGGHEVFRAHDPLYTRVSAGFDELNASLLDLFGTDVYHWNDAAERFGLARGVRIASTDLEGAIDTGMMMSALLRKVREAGVTIRTGADVVALEETTDRITLVLADGTRMSAGHVVVATNGFTKQLLPDVDVSPGRGQVLITTPIAGLKLKGTFHLDAGYYYFRDVDGAVLLGGGRNLDPIGETTFEDATTPVIEQALDRVLRELILPDREFRVAVRWSGVMGFGTRSKSPLVQRRSERITLAVRLGGIGVAMGIRVARKAAALASDGIA
ncbi:MAG: FAD-binding oxidoreductase [Flavobacteriales bacterium]|nr:FAD-binding oxidoreductase [Flavobacteriales bacterium]